MRLANYLDEYDSIPDFLVVGLVVVASILHILVSDFF
jgi:hypothetical protein